MPKKITKYEKMQAAIRDNNAIGTAMCKIVAALGAPNAYHRDGRILLTAHELAKIILRTGDGDVADNAVDALVRLSDPEKIE